MEIPSSQRLNHKNLTLTALVGMLGLCEDEKEDRALKEQFYYRFHEKLYDRIHKSTHKLFKGQPDCDEIRDDTFQETFMVAFQKIKGFKAKDTWDDSECHKVVLHWLGDIANNLLLKQRDIAKEDVLKFENYYYAYKADIRKGSIGKTKYKPTYDRAKFDKVWEKFSPMAKEVLILCMEYETIGKNDEENTKHLPDSVIKQLTEKYNVTKENIRQTKSRALKAIKSCKIENDL